MNQSEDCLDHDQKLVIKFENKRPVDLVDLTKSLLSLGNEYQRFVESQLDPEYRISTNLFIKEIRSGSIVVELVSSLLPTLPLLWTDGPFVEWLKVAGPVVEWLRGKLVKEPAPQTQTSLTNWKNIVEPVAKDNGSQMFINASDRGMATGPVTFNFNFNDANAMQNTASRLLDAQEATHEHVRVKQLMTWDQAKFDTSADTGSKGVIEQISSAPVKVVFLNHQDKEAIFAGDERFRKPWQELAYLVDVEIQTINGRPRMYKILRYYPEHTLDPAVE